MEQQATEAHTPEPWRWMPNLHAYGPLKGAYIDDVAGTARVADVLSHAGVGQQRCEANARRIVACVNACATISTEALEQGQPGYALGTLSCQLETERSLVVKLRGILKDVLDQIHLDRLLAAQHPVLFERYNKARVLLAKTKAQR